MEPSTAASSKPSAQGDGAESETKIERAESSASKDSASSENRAPSTGQPPYAIDGAFSPALAWPRQQ